MITIRRFMKTDAEQCAKLIQKSIKELNSEDYPKEVIQFMVRRSTAQEMLILNMNRDFIVAVDGKKVVGTATLEKNYVGSVFAHPKYIGKGVGRMLMEEIESMALEKGVKRLEFGASLTAVGFYMKLGYKLGEEIDTGPMGIVIKASKILTPLQKQE